MYSFWTYVVSPPPTHVIILKPMAATASKVIAQREGAGGTTGGHNIWPPFSRHVQISKPG